MNTSITTKPYIEQENEWPQAGKHILAHYDADTIIVYQAYNEAIGRFAINNQQFGGEFSYSRMSWIKPNFLWMMYRSGWGTKSNQEITLGLRLRREFFDLILSNAVASSLSQSHFDNQKEWKAALPASDIRLQWDPDHDPAGRPLERRAIQLGLRGNTLADFAKQQLLEVIDMTEFVTRQRQILQAEGIQGLHMPYEKVYNVTNQETRDRLKLS